MNPTELAQFEAKISPEPNSGCWLWTGSYAGGGYGKFWFEKRLYSAHRLAYEHWVGPIPDGLILMHSCDVRVCVNPAHLTPGTSLQNARDMWRKGRGARGERNGRSKLNPSVVSYIYDMISAGYTYSAIGRRLDLSGVTVSRVARACPWSHLHD